MYLASAHHSEDELAYLFASQDGKKFGLINEFPVAPTLGTQRDPSIVFFDGKYVMAVTHGTSTTFNILESEDLVNWSQRGTVDMASIGSVHRVWAPELWVDGTTLRAFVSVSTSGSTSNFQIYETSEGASSWTTPTKLTITGRSNVIDPFMVKVGSDYFLWYKEEDNDYIEYAKATSLTGTYTVQESGNWASWGSPVEAPCLIELPNGDWRIYMNEHAGFDSVQIWYSESTDDWATWSTKVAIETPILENQFAHMTVLEMDTDAMIHDTLLTKAGNDIPSFAEVVRSTNFNIFNNTGTVISWASETFDTDDYWSTGSKLTVNAPGLYRVEAHVKWAGNATGKRVLDLRANGTKWRGAVSAPGSHGSTNDPDMSTSWTFFLNAEEYVEAVVFQNSGGSLNVSAAQMTITKVG